jgi:AcrR family transcriptional regulator
MARKIDPAKRQAILDAARLVFLRDGYQESKMSTIATEAGVAPGTLYLYFDSKESLASSIGEEIFARMISEFARVINDLGTPAGVEKLVDWSADIAMRERDLLRLIKMQKPQTEIEMKKEEAGPKQQFRQHLSNLLEHLMQTPGARKYDSASLADIVLSLLHGLFDSCLYSEDRDMTPVKKATAEVLKHALFEDSRLASAISSQPNA